MGNLDLSNQWGSGQGTDQIAQAASDGPVSLALVVDVSASISDADYNIQREGTALALRNVSNEILQMAEEGTPVILSYTEFAGEAQMRIPPTVIRDAEDLGQLAQQIEYMERQEFEGATLTSEAMAAGTAIHRQVEEQYGPLSRKVTDISADGYATHPFLHTMEQLYDDIEADEVAAVLTQREIALAEGIEINGIVMPDARADIMRALRAGDPDVSALRDDDGQITPDEIERIIQERPDLISGPNSSLAVNEAYHQQNVITGFSVRARNAEEYGETLELKLRRELFVAENDATQADGMGIEFQGGEIGFGANKI